MAAVLHLAYFLEIGKAHYAFSEHIGVGVLGAHTKRSCRVSFSNVVFVVGSILTIFKNTLGFENVLDITFPLGM